ncbi:MAG: phosphoadenosine phosphosulfate reductase family protein, partial [Chthoniobacterales bacterium]
MKHIGCFSGGKDSTALMLWMCDELGTPGEQWTPVFCDTGWEHPITYAYIEEINLTILAKTLVTLKPTIGTMRDLVQIKGRVPSAKARFCTENLKTEPMKEWLTSINDDFTVYQGIRRDESYTRSLMCAVEFSDIYDCKVVRPLFHWSARECFELAALHGVRPNPLYLMGASRVG